MCVSKFRLSRKKFGARCTLTHKRYSQKQINYNGRFWLGEINLQSKHDVTYHVAKVKATNVSAFHGDVIPFYCRVHYWDGLGVDIAEALWHYGAMALWK